MAAKTKKRPVASINAPKPKPKPKAPAKTKVSMGGQFLVAWQQKNPGMFMPGVTLEQAGTSGVLGNYDSGTALKTNQDPAWAVAYLQQMAKSGKGPLAKSTTGTLGTDDGSGDLGPGPGESGISNPPYIASPELAAMRQMAGNRIGAIDAQAGYDTGQVGYRAGVGTGADPENRFSQFNLLNRAFGRTLTGLETGAASIGQRFSGQYQQQLGDAEFNRGQEQYGIENSARDATAAVTRQSEQDKYAVDQGLAQGEMADRAAWYDQLRKMATPTIPPAGGL